MRSRHSLKRHPCGSFLFVDCKPEDLYDTMHENMRPFSSDPEYSTLALDAIENTSVVDGDILLSDHLDNLL